VCESFQNLDASSRRNFRLFLFIAVDKAFGFLAVSILRPTKWSPDEYAMISEWQDETALKAFAGDNWNRAVIPLGWRNL